jgi:hypothetical protein
MKVVYLPLPLGEIVRDVLSRGDDRPWTTPQVSRGAWSEERLAGWRTDPDVTAQLAALTSLDFSKYELGSYQRLRDVKVKRMLLRHCFVCMHMYSVLHSI